MSTNQCYICGSNDVSQEDNPVDKRSEIIHFEEFFRFDNKIIFICTKCYWNISDVYGSGGQSGTEIIDPPWYKTKEKGGWLSTATQQKTIRGQCATDMRNDKEEFRNKILGVAAADKENYKSTRTKLKKEFKIVKNNWDKVFTKILKASGEKITFDDVMQYFKQMDDIPKPTKLKLLEWESLITEDFVEEEDVSHYLKGFYVNGECEAIDPYYVMNSLNEISEFHDWKEFDCYDERDVVKASLESCVFDINSKIKRTGNYRYYIDK